MHFLFPSITFSPTQLLAYTSTHSFNRQSLIHQIGHAFTQVTHFFTTQLEHSFTHPESKISISLSNSNSKKDYKPVNFIKFIRLKCNHYAFRHLKELYKIQKAKKKKKYWKIAMKSFEIFRNFLNIKRAINFCDFLWFLINFSIVNIRFILKIIVFAVQKNSSDVWLRMKEMRPKLCLFWIILVN